MRVALTENFKRCGPQITIIQAQTFQALIGSFQRSNYVFHSIFVNAILREIQEAKAFGLFDIGADKSECRCLEAPVRCD